jgi:tetratricopeptide (TPR) repeat protein
VIVATAGVAGALAFGVLANEREFDRLIAEGDASVVAERPFQAIEAYSGAIARKPDSPLAHFKRGAVYQSQNELENALRDFRSAATSIRGRSRARSAGRRQRSARPP